VEVHISLRATQMQASIGNAYFSKLQQQYAHLNTKHNACLQ
jgi:hypothetical protein